MRYITDILYFFLAMPVFLRWHFFAANCLTIKQFSYTLIHFADNQRLILSYTYTSKKKPAVCAPF